MAQAGPEGPRRGVRAFAGATICPSPAWMIRKSPGHRNTLRGQGRGLAPLAAPQPSTLPGHHPHPSLGATHPPWLGRSRGSLHTGSPHGAGDQEHLLGAGNGLTGEDGVGGLSGPLHSPAQLPHADIMPALGPRLGGGCSCKSPGSAPLGQHMARGLHGHPPPPAVPAKGCVSHPVPVPSAAWLLGSRLPARGSHRSASHQSRQHTSRRSHRPALHRCSSRCHRTPPQLHRGRHPPGSAVWLKPPLMAKHPRVESGGERAQQCHPL